MLNVKQTLVTAMLVLFVTAVQGQAASVSWDAKSGDTISFGKSYRGGGPSKLTLYDGAGPGTLGIDSDPRSMTTLSYYNATNKMKCFIFCRRTKTQKRMFSIYDGETLISRGMAYVKSTPNPRGDIFRLTIDYLAEGYHWVGAGKHRICERCSYNAQLIGPEPSAVPLPPTVALLFSTILGMFGIGKRKKRKSKKQAKNAVMFKKSPSLFYTEKG